VSSQNSFLPAAEGGKKELVNRPAFTHHLPPAEVNIEREVSGVIDKIGNQIGYLTDVHFPFVLYTISKSS